MRSVEETVRSYFRAFEAGDVAAISSLFTGDGAIVPDRMATFRGRSAIESAFKKIFGSISMRCELLEFDRIEEFGDTAIAETHSRETVTSRSEGSSATSEYRELFCLRRNDTSWQIISYMFNNAGA